MRREVQGHLIIQTHGTLLDCENECEQDTMSLEEYTPTTFPRSESALT
eukprot:COSAG03_NODE_375_length_8413_cov_177.997835_4_plen_48_part_00